MKDKKGIHSLYSPKIHSKRDARRKAASKGNRDEDGNILPPPTVNNFKQNKPLFGPHKIKKKTVEVQPRKIAKTEGKPTVNAKTNTERFIHPPVTKTPEMDPAIGAIEPTTKKKTSRRGRRKKTNGES